MNSIGEGQAEIDDVKSRLARSEELRQQARVLEEEAASLLSFQPPIQSRSRGSSHQGSPSAALNPALWQAKLTLTDLSAIFSALDVRRAGKVSHADFIRQVKENAWVADKLGMPMDERSAEGSRATYHFSFGELADTEAKFMDLIDLCRLHGFVSDGSAWPDTHLSRCADHSSSELQEDTARVQVPQPAVPPVSEPRARSVFAYFGEDQGIKARELRGLEGATKDSCDQALQHNSPASSGGKPRAKWQRPAGLDFDPLDFGEGEGVPPHSAPRSTSPKAGGGLRNRPLLGQRPEPASHAPAPVGTRTQHGSLFADVQRLLFVSLVDPRCAAAVGPY